jgi:hypothetical protein
LIEWARPKVWGAPIRRFGDFFLLLESLQLRVDGFFPLTVIIHPLWFYNAKEKTIGKSIKALQPWFYASGLCIAIKRKKENQGMNLVKTRVLKIKGVTPSGGTMAPCIRPQGKWQLWR